MPVSHLGLTVSQIPTATSFYLATLAPLGYRYIGQSGDSIGLGVDHADFFLTQEPRGQAVSPTHIAFSADSRLTVRNCYAAALSSGAHPSGAPSYRDRDCTVFNAAVEDLDGNVVEFVYREQIQVEDDTPTVTAPEDSRVLTWQKDVATSGLHSDVGSLTSRTSRARSRAETVKDLVSSASRTVRSRSEAPTPGLTRARTMPVTSATTTEFPSQAIFGTILGATAGVAVAWAMMKAEDGNAQSEARHAASTRSRSATRQSFDDTRSHRNYSTTESRAPPSHRNFSVTESAFSRKYPPRSLARSMGRSIRAIEPAPAYNDSEVQEAISRYASSRRPTAPRRSNTIDAIEYAPVSSRDSRYTAKRSVTMPINEPAGYLEAPRTTVSTSRHSRASGRDRRQPVVEEDDEVREPVPIPTSHYTTASRRSPRQSVQDEDQDLKRRDSGVSMGSHRSHHSHRSRRGAVDADQGSSASTLKPSRRGSSHHDTAAAIPLPASKAASRVSRAQSYVTAAQVPIPESQHGAGCADASAEDSDGLGDARTVVPEDSISCVDFSKPRSSARSSQGGRRSSKHGSSKRSEAAGSDRTVRPARKESSRHSAATLPVRGREEYYSSGGKKRSTVSYA